MRVALVLVVALLAACGQGAKKPSSPAPWTVAALDRAQLIWDCRRPESDAKTDCECVANEIMGIKDETALTALLLHARAENDAARRQVVDSLGPDRVAAMERAKAAAVETCSSRQTYWSVAVAYPSRFSEVDRNAILAKCLKTNTPTACVCLIDQTEGALDQGSLNAWAKTWLVDGPDPLPISNSDPYRLPDVTLDVGKTMRNVKSLCRLQR